MYCYIHLLLYFYCYLCLCVCVGFWMILIWFDGMCDSIVQHGHGTRTDIMGCALKLGYKKSVKKRDNYAYGGEFMQQHMFWRSDVLDRLAASYIAIMWLIWTDLPRAPKRKKVEQEFLNNIVVVLNLAYLFHQKFASQNVQLQLWSFASYKYFQPHLYPFIEYIYIIIYIYIHINPTYNQL